KKLTHEIADATLKGDHGKLMDHTYDGVIKQLGGREKAIAAIDAVTQALKAQGITVKSFKVGEPGDFLSEGGNTFVVVPTVMEMTFPGGKAIGKSYVLAISSDGGKSWKFVDGAGIEKQ